MDKLELGEHRTKLSRENYSIWAVAIEKGLKLTATWKPVALIRWQYIENDAVLKWNVIYVGEDCGAIRKRSDRFCF